MKKWEKYKDYIERGEWHTHTNYTDGENTVFEICEQAEKNGLELIAFTEHVRKELDYNFNDLISDIESARKKFNLKILVGCEAKVLDPKGNLDVSKDVLKKCDLVLGVFHSFPYDRRGDYLLAIKNMLKNPEVDIWGHPTLFAKKNNIKLKEDEIEEIVDLCIKNNVLIEINSRYKLPDSNFLEIIKRKGAKTIMGADVHHIVQLRNMRRSE